MVKIRFSSEEDEVKGFYLLATRARLRGLPDGWYEVTEANLALLEQNSVPYVAVRASESTLDETEAVRNSPTVEL